MESPASADRNFIPSQLGLIANLFKSPLHVLLHKTEENIKTATLSELHSKFSCLSFQLFYFLHKGWWLSMEPEDAFFKRLQCVDDISRFYEKSERFGTWNSKTLGIILVRTDVALALWVSARDYTERRKNSHRKLYTN